MFYPVFAAIDVRKIAIKRRTSSISTHKTIDSCMNSVDDSWLPSARWKIHLLKKYAANDWLNILLNFSRPTTCNAISRKKNSQSQVFIIKIFCRWRCQIGKCSSNVEYRIFLRKEFRRIFTEFTSGTPWVAIFYRRKFMIEAIFVWSIIIINHHHNMYYLHGLK